MKRFNLHFFLRFSFSHLLLSLLLMGPLLLVAQTYSGHLTLSNQAAVDAFSYSEITGSLTISGSDINNLNGLASLTSVGGTLKIKDTKLTNLVGLSSLSSIGKEMSIFMNLELINLDGLSSLTFIGEGLGITYNLLLTNLNGLSSLTSVGGLLRVDYNKKLVEFCGLYSLLEGGREYRLYHIEDNRNNPYQQDIRDGGPCVQDPFTLIKNMLTNGTLNQGQANALNTKLNKCKLNAFNNQINDWGSTGILTQRQANNLIQAAASHCN